MGLLNVDTIKLHPTTHRDKNGKYFIQLYVVYLMFSKNFIAVVSALKGKYFSH